LAAAQDSARKFIAELPEGLQVGLVTYDYSANLIRPPTDDRVSLLAALDTIELGNGTNTGAGLETALTAVENVPPDADGRPAPSAVILMSDGTPTVGTGLLSPEASVEEQSVRAAEMGVPISTIAFGTDDGTVVAEGDVIPVPSDPETLAAIAAATGGEAFTAESAAELGSVYDAIGSAVGYDRETVDISAWAAGLALLFGALAAAAALVWTQQLA
jgi:Ca-activated chloride channel family protein